MRILISFTLGLGLLSSAPVAFGQAAASYGVAASKSAGMTAAAGKKLGNQAKRSSKSLERRLSRATTSTMEQNRKKFAEAARDSGATLKVESAPEKAMVTVDGEPVGHTPIELILPEGTHRVRVAAAGFEPWEKETEMKGDGNLSLRAELKKRYKSNITVSFDD